MDDEKLDLIRSIISPLGIHTGLYDAAWEQRFIEVVNAHGLSSEQIKDSVILSLMFAQNGPDRRPAQILDAALQEMSLPNPRSRCLNYLLSRIARLYSSESREQMERLAEQIPVVQIRDLFQGPSFDPQESAIIAELTRLAVADTPPPHNGEFATVFAELNSLKSAMVARLEAFVEGLLEPKFKLEWDGDGDGDLYECAVIAGSTENIVYGYWFEPFRVDNPACCYTAESEEVCICGLARVDKGPLEAVWEIPDEVPGPGYSYSSSVLSEMSLELLLSIWEGSNAN